MNERKKKRKDRHPKKKVKTEGIRKRKPPVINDYMSIPPPTVMACLNEPFPSSLAAR